MKEIKIERRHEKSQTEEGRAMETYITCDKCATFYEHLDYCVPSYLAPQQKTT